ncbi:aldo/keto reductase [Mucilaginibacter daejeonensis]|uniref:aldo/keto reductase n=1 Tax=Mucilaginibacter daejeonensis TaxID=398049 RepID=UPI001D179584|nr:aldo/keto reductase [Mucilaginibacter daejeonensis]UEG52536.1 aldo/keto reductase [Mucilaginibacter daejeonensis]
MEYRKLGTSELQVSAITFGAWAAGGWMWGGNDDREAIAAMRAAYDLGITSIDTAPIYGQGKSEELVGQAIKGIPRDKVQILDKFGMRWDLAKGTFGFKSKDNSGKDIDIYKYAGMDSVIKECEDSLKRLGTDHIDLYQLHWPDASTPIDETMEALVRLKEQGKILQAGVSNYNVAQMKEAAKTIDLVSDQVPYSMVNRGIESELLPYCIEHQKSILAYSPMERGLLTGKMKPGQSFGEGDHRAGVKFFKDENIERTNNFLAKIKPLAEEKNATIGQLVIRWTIDRPGITVALVGARNAEQATQNAKAINVKLSAEEHDMITAELDKLQLVD